MKVHVYSIMRNEAPILPYWLRHYQQFAERIVVYDDRSDDGTIGILDANPKVTRLVGPHGIDDEAFARIFSTQPHALSQDADWVICVDADEFVYRNDIVNVLRAAKIVGVDVIDCETWMMLSESFPTTTGQIYDEIYEGVPDASHLKWKPIVFRPQVKLAFHPGRHGAEINGARGADVGIRTLHYRFMGRDYAFGRHRKNASKLSAVNKANGYGVHNTSGWGGIYSEDWFNAALQRKVKVL